MHFFELRLEQLPELRLDNREIIGARLVPAAELRGTALTEPVTAYSLPAAAWRQRIAGYQLSLFFLEVVQTTGAVAERLHRITQKI